MKNSNAARANTRQRLNINFCSKTIILQLVSQCNRHETLTEAIHRRELTKSLEILSEYGFHGDLGILAIRHIQDLGRVA